MDGARGKDRIQDRFTIGRPCASFSSRPIVRSEQRRRHRRRHHPCRVQDDVGQRLEKKYRAGDGQAERRLYLERVALGKAVARRMKIPHPDDLPPSLRRLVSRLLPARLRSQIATRLQDLANMQYRLDSRFRSNQASLGRLSGSKRDSVCVIMGNGPSVRGFDLARLDGVDTFCLNRGYLLWNAAGRSPRYVVATNNLVIEQFSRELADIVATRFLPWDYAGLFSDPGSLFVPLRWRRGFYRDVRRGLWVGGTVTFAAMQIAYHIGYRRVVLIGVDHAFTFEGRPNEKLTARVADPNHFDPNYFGPGTEWHAPDLALSEISYRMAREAFERDGREIIDATEGGRLRIFQKMPLERALVA